MPTRNISLTKEQDAFIDEVLRTGEYRNASEAVRDAIRMLKARRIEESLRLDRLRVAIGQGIAALDRGEHVELGDDELDDYFDGLASPADR
ncbi:MAG: type II toxin-antitoxin system ParD family antitoxin [Alphaproteobacteria bacterium]|nr:type II toxin-antitoxin system ParD family antitoxin [Alphaproteobacteria bacterium]